MNKPVTERITGAEVVTRIAERLARTADEGTIYGITRDGVVFASLVPIRTVVVETSANASIGW